jgi:hypothetical protein
MLEPNVIFDKSFIEMLNADELRELCMFFGVVSTPILRSEILADLQKKSQQERDSMAVMKSLSEKMSRSGLEVMNYRSAALGELRRLFKVPMHGALLIDGSAPNVTFRNGGVVIDGRELQWDWRRWSQGAFTEEEINLASEHRKNLEKFDPEEYCRQRGGMTKKNFGHCKNLGELISYIESLIADPRSLTQELILRLTLTTLYAGPDVAEPCLSLFKAGQIPNVRDFAPYAVSVMKIFMTYSTALARGFFGPRRSDICDLEYLYYAPFCRVFISGDRLQKSMWTATTTRALFYTGAEFKADLKMRVALRKENPERVAGMYPIPVEGSVITDAFTKIRALERS